MRILALFSVFVLSFATTFGQFRNIRLNAQPGTENLNEPGVAINPKNPKNIIVSASQGYLFVTHDEGATWQNITTGPSQGYGNSALIADTQGDFYLFHPSGPSGETDKPVQTVVQYSGDDGKTWSADIPIAIDQSKDWVRPWPAIDEKGNLVLTWSQFDKYGNADPNCQSSILMSTSRNGKKWNELVQISQTPGNCLGDGNSAKGAIPAIIPDGKAFVAWANQGKIFLDRSFDGGDVWLMNDLAVVELRGWSSLRIPGLKPMGITPVFMADKSKGTFAGSLYLGWADQRNGENDTDVWFIRSVNYGDNWTTPMKLSKDGTGKHQFLPGMTVDPASGYIYVVYYDRRNYNDLQTDVYLAYSVDGGNSFKEVRISETPFAPSESVPLGEHINIAAYKGVITPVWTRIDDGKASIWTCIIRHAQLPAK